LDGEVRGGEYAPTSHVGNPPVSDPVEALYEFLVVGREEFVRHGSTAFRIPVGDQMAKKKLTKQQATNAVLEKMIEAFELGNGVLYKINKRDASRVTVAAQMALTLVVALLPDAE
jgi:hypothetical protein